jgi:uncharacterized membrane protein YraQ (UPF0718 family)/copper chaperone CopZ
LDIIIDILKEFLSFYYEVAVYLLFGFILAGILHLFFPESFIRRHLGRDTFGSVIKSTLFGIPLPICSCGVVPVAASLKNSGASRGAVISFLIATPQVGADSFMITYSLLGWIFGVFRIVASLITSLAAGIFVNLTGNGNQEQILNPGNNATENFTQRIKLLPGYIEYELLGSIANPLIIGLLIAGLIAVFIPDNFFELYLDRNIISMLLMLVIGIPMYVCASASTPVAAALIMKGLSPGAALVFLLTGPATNAIGISTIIKIVGKKSTLIYLTVIALTSLAAGYLLNVMAGVYGFQKIIMLHQHEMLPAGLKIFGAAALTLMLAWYYASSKIHQYLTKKNKAGKDIVRLNVSGMSCMHCSQSVKKAVESVEGASNVTVDLAGRKVGFAIRDTKGLEKVKQAIIFAGFAVEGS